MKQIKKLSLSNVISKLTRNEMRYVMAGSGSTDFGYSSYGECIIKTSCYSRGDGDWECFYYGGRYICSHP